VLGKGSRIFQEESSPPWGGQINPWIMPLCCAESTNCSSALRQLGGIRRSVIQPVLLSPVTSLILTCLDCGRATLSDVPVHLLNRLQSVLNAAERLVCHNRITHLLGDLHWSPVPPPTDRACLPLTSQHGDSVRRPWPVLYRRHRRLTPSTSRSVAG